MESMMAGRGGFWRGPLEAGAHHGRADPDQGPDGGRFPAPPISEVLGFDTRKRNPGRVVFTYTPVFGHYNPLGPSMAASPPRCSIRSWVAASTPRSRPAIGFTTVEIKVNYVRAMTDKTGPGLVEGKGITPARASATSEGKLYDGAGKLLAHGTTTCLIFPDVTVIPSEPPAGRRSRGTSLPRPHQRGGPPLRASRSGRDDG